MGVPLHLPAPGRSDVPRFSTPSLPPGMTPAFHCPCPVPGVVFPYPAARKAAHPCSPPSPKRPKITSELDSTRFQGRGLSAPKAGVAGRFPLHPSPPGLPGIPLGRVLPPPCPPHHWPATGSVDLMRVGRVQGTGSDSGKKRRCPSEPCRSDVGNCSRNTGPTKTPPR